MALGVPGGLRLRIFSTFGTTRVVGRQPNAPAVFTPREILGSHFQTLGRPQGTWFCRKEPRKKSQVAPPGIDPGTVRLVAQRLNHYATPGRNNKDEMHITFKSTIYYEHSKLPTCKCFDHICGHPQGGTLQRIYYKRTL